MLFPLRWSCDGREGARPAVSSFVDGLRSSPSSIAPDNGRRLYRSGPPGIRRTGSCASSKVPVGGREASGWWATTVRKRRAVSIDQTPNLESREGIRCDVESRDFNVLEEIVKFIRVQKDLSKSLITGTFTQHSTTVERYLLMLVPTAEKKEVLKINMIKENFQRRKQMKEETHPWTRVKRISGLVQMYSTVGDRVPICLLRMLLNICATSFLP